MAPDLKKHRRKIRHKYNYREKKKTHRTLDRRHRESTKFPLKTHDHKQTVSDLVYQYLGNLANVNQRRKQRHNARSIFHRNHIRKQPRSLHPNRDMIDITSEPVLQSNLKLNVPTYLPLTYEISSSKIPRSSASKKIVNDYAKAINEGRNIARKYVCKALSFGVNSGFLVPADNKGQLLRVSSNLCLFQSGQNMGRNEVFKKLRYDPACLKKIKRKRLTNNKARKSYAKSPRGTRLRRAKKKTKKRKTRK